jgi:hypothetical protein
MNMNMNEKLKKKKRHQALVICTFNPSYSGGKDQEDRGLPAQGKSFSRPYLKKTLHKIGWLSGLRYRPLSSSSSTRKKKKTNI